MAPRRDFQRAPRRNRREMPEEGSKAYLEGALRTRKWTDNGGQEGYTTEALLQRFRGELTMLDAARGAGGPPLEGGYDEAGFADEPRATAIPARGRTPLNDLDDDIPF